MNKSFSVLIVATVLQFAVSAIAQENSRVVVIPLAGKTTVNVANFTGAWQPNTTYQAGQVVQIDGSAYVALMTHTSDSTTPDLSNWSLMAAKGDTGPQGPQGEKGDPGIQGIPGPAGVIVTVNDANDSFLGYLIAADGEGKSFTLISAQNYIAMFSGYVDPQWTLLPGVAVAAGLQIICYGRVWYDNSGCTGTYYVQTNLDNLFRRVQPGIVCGGTTTPIVVQPHYIPRNATTTTIDPAYVLSSDGVCVGPASNPVTVYQAIPNDPAVTGFQNTFTGPFKPVGTAP